MAGLEKQVPLTLSEVKSMDRDQLLVALHAPQNFHVIKKIAKSYPNDLKIIRAVMNNKGCVKSITHDILSMTSRQEVQATVYEKTHGISPGNALFVIKTAAEEFPQVRSL